MLFSTENAKGTAFRNINTNPPIFCDENTRYTIPNTKCNKYIILMPKTLNMSNKAPSRPIKTKLRQTKHQIRQPKYQVYQPKHQVCKTKHKICQLKYQNEVVFQNINLCCFVARQYFLANLRTLWPTISRPKNGVSVQKKNKYQVCTQFTNQLTGCFSGIPSQNVWICVEFRFSPFSKKT